jgi:hypothetical protein
MKNCNKCNGNLELEMFSVNKRTKDGLQNFCKPCNKISHKEHYLNNIDKIKEKSKFYRENNPNKIKEWVTNHPNYHKEYNEEWIKSNSNYHKEYYLNNIDKVKESSKNYDKTNPNFRKDLYQSDKAYYISKSIKYILKRRKEDSIFKIKSNIISSIYSSFKRACNGKFTKSKRTELILGCTIEDFIKHLQSLFTENMTLKNHGKWEMDHIIPISSAKTEEDIIRLNHYTNFQPLWKEDNRKKGNKIL